MCKYVKKVAAGIAIIISICSFDGVRRTKNYTRECYFCLTNVKGFSAVSKRGIQYPNLPLVKRPVPHDGFPIPKTQVTGPLMMKARRDCQKTGMELQPV